MEGTISAQLPARPRPWLRWLNYALQTLWVVSAVFIVQLYILSIRPGYIELMKVCSEPVCPSGQLTMQGRENLDMLGISLSAFAIIELIVVFAIAAIYGVISLLIFRAKRHDNLALYVALVLLYFGSFVSTYVDVLRLVQPAFTDLIDILPGVTLISFTILCYVFPDGRFVPRWTRWAAWGWIAAPMIMIFSFALDFYEAVEGPMSIAVLVLLATCIVAPIYRYRKLASRIQRQQLKWVLLGLTQLLATMLILVELLPLYFPVLDEAGTLPNLVSNIVQSVSLAIFPISIGIALLRYRLWNVDLVINRTLVYVPLTSILTVIYTTSIAVSQRLFVTATGEQSQAVAIFTTIVLTTTFTPIKNALQTYVDRHFKEAPGNLRELKEINKQVTQVVQALDHKSLAQRVVETIVNAHEAKGAALYLREGERMVLAYATPNWTWSESEVSILLTDDDHTGNLTGNLTGNKEILGRLLVGQPGEREDYTLDEIEEIRATAVPLVRNIQRLVEIHSGV